MRHWLLLILLWIGLGLRASAQAWQRDPVLSTLKVRGIIPDTAGFLWAATDRGVFRYDGYQAISLNDLIQRGPHLPARPVLQLELAGGHIWIGTDAGLYAYAAGRLQQVALPPHPGGQMIAKIRYQPRTGLLWVGYGSEESGVAALDPVRCQVRVRPHLRESGAVREVLNVADGGIWVLWANRHVWRLDAAGHPREQLRIEAFSFSLGPNRQVASLSRNEKLAVPGTGERWLLDRHRLYEVQPDGQERVVQHWEDSTHLSARHINTFTAFESDSTWYWSGCNKQLLALQWRRRTPLRVTPIAPPAPYQTGYYWFAKGIDDNLLWANNADRLGCYKRRQRQASAQALVVAAGPPISSRAIARLPDGRLLVGSYNGTWLQAADSVAAPLRHITQLPGVVRALLTTRRGEVVVANEFHDQGLISVLNPQTLTVAPVQWLRPPPPHGSAFCLLEDHAGRVWAGTTFGLVEFDLERRQARRYRDADPTFPLHTCNINQITEAPAGVLWLATNNGLFRFQTATGRLTRYAPDEPAPRRLPSVETLCVTATHPDSLWVGTLDQGLLLVNPRRGLIRQLTPALGLPSAEVSLVLPDTQPGILWVGTAAGLVRYLPRSGQLNVLTEVDGLASNEANRGSAWRDSRTGYLYFGGVGGVSYLDPAQSFEPPARPRLLLTSIKQHHADGDTVLTQWLWGPAPKEGIRIGPRDLFAELEFALTDHEAPQLARYAYRLVGGPDRRFRPLGTAHTLRLQGLAAGDYTIEIRGETRQGVAARNVLRIPLTVADLWWRRPWAWALGALLLAGVVYAVQRQRIRRLLREQQLRTRIAADLHDEVGALLTRVNLQAELLNATGAAPHQLGNLLDDSRAAVATMRDVVWSIDAQADTVGALLDRMRDHLDRTAEPADLLTDLRVEGLSDAEALPAEVRQHLYLIFKEAVTNAVRHGRALTRIDVRLARERGHLTLEVRNDGAVLTAPAGRSGLGLRSMVQRAHALGGTLTTGPLPAGGYRVLLEV